MPSPDMLQFRAASPVNRPRVTYQLNMYHQLVGEDSKQIQLNGDCFLDIPESPFDRTLSIGEQFVKLDFMWLTNDQIKTIILYNTTGTNRTTLPTDEEKEADSSAIIHLSPLDDLVVAPKDPPTIIHVGPSFNGLSVRCAKGTARLRCIGIPK